MYIREETIDGELKEVLYPDEGKLLLNVKTTVVSVYAILDENNKEEDYVEVSDPMFNIETSENEE